MEGIGDDEGMNGGGSGEGGACGVECNNIKGT
jgi:hypothetical protein